MEDQRFAFGVENSAIGFAGYAIAAYIGFHYGAKTWPMGHDGPMPPANLLPAYIACGS